MGQRLLFLDGLRAIAAICVMLQHMLEQTPVNYLFGILSPGLFGVVLFFFISGFIIPYSVGSVLDPDKFVINRVFRIFPAYLVVLFVPLLIGWAGVQPWATTVTGPERDAFWLTANLLMVADYVGEQSIVGVAWTLPLEFAWYAAFGVLFALFGRRFALFFTVGLSLLLLACSIAAVQADMRLPIGRLSLVNAASIGYLFYLRHMDQLSGPRVAAGVTAFALSTLLSFTITYTAFPHPNVEISNILITWGAGLAFFAAAMLSPALRHSRLLTHPVTCGLGEISYSVYLVHGLVLALLLISGVPFAVTLILTPLLTFAISWVMYHYVERTGVNLGRRLYRGMKTRDVEVLSYLYRKLRPAEVAREP